MTIIPFTCCKEKLNMKFLTAGRFLAVIIILLITPPVCNAQHKRYVRNPERSLFGKSLNHRQAKYREAPSIERAKKKQEDNQKKLDREYADAVKASQKRALQIQSPEVRNRMIANRKDADARYKQKAKKTAKNSRKSGRKYK